MMVLPHRQGVGAIRRSRLPSYEQVLSLSLLLNGCLALFLVWIVHNNTNSQSKQLQHEDMTWNGGHPAKTRSGTCWCSGMDHYCMCTPALAIDLVVVSGIDQFWLVQRKDTNQWATIGGFVMVGESIEDCVRRELKEETGIVLTEAPILIGIYSDPRRDNRRHTVSAVYAILLDGSEQPKASDDAKAVRRIPAQDVEKYDFFADHQTILLDYRRKYIHGGLPKAENELFPNLARSVCECSSFPR